MPVGASATGWSIEPSLMVGFEHYDNLAYTNPKSGNVTATILYPEIDFAAEQENWDVRVVAQTRHARYSENRFDNNAATARIFSRYFAERSQWQLDASAIDDSMLTNDQIDLDTGRPNGHHDRASRTVSPTWTYFLQQTSQIKLNLQGTTVDYHDGDSVGLYSYEQRGGNTQYVWLSSELTKLYVTIGSSTFKVPSLQYESTTHSAQIGFSRQWTETLSTDISAGRRQTMSEGLQQVCPPGTVDRRFEGRGCREQITAFTAWLWDPIIVAFSDTTDGTTLNASLSKRYELTALSVNLSRSLDPSGSGTQVETDSAQVRIERPLIAEQLMTSLTLERRETRAIGGNPTLVDRDYERIEPRLRWLMARDWTVDFTYRHIWQKYHSIEDDISSNSLSAALNYHWPKISISR